FKNKGVPYSFFFTDFHGDYHKPSDHADKLAYDNMVKIARTGGLILQAAADREARLRFAGGRRVAPDDDEEPSEPPRLLGIQGQPLSDAECEKLGLAEGQGGLRVGAVSEGGVAKAAGMRKGDVVLSLGGKTLGREEPRDDLFAALAQVKPGVATEVVVLRDGKKTALQATWDK
ncbi:MAG: PDZ domain-containing protein, partial [Planctomycetes bacterium]|nr:PDZ domain-containing protein [Planctomycetota bacterium]